jgi:predicted Zn-dependent peptidase
MYLNAQLTQLSNGLSIIVLPTPDAYISHCSLLINAGSRNEQASENGIAHFIEHLLFKGTKKRNSFQVLNRLEVVGGELNAYTTKEHVCIYASVPNSFLNQALELVNDIIFHSTFPEKEIEKEKGVILDEINSYKDIPEDWIFDLSDEIVYANHALGRPILGSEESLAGLGKKEIQSFMDTHFQPQHMVLAIATALPEKKVLKWAEKHFGHIRSNTTRATPQEVPAYKAQNLDQERAELNQSHVLITNRIFGIQNPLKDAALLLNSMIGGPGMTSLLNLKIREKHGIAYNIESGINLYSDTGNFYIYLSTDAKKSGKALRLIHTELEKMYSSLSLSQIEKAKKKLIGQICLAEENKLNVIGSMSKSVLDLGMIESLPQIFERIQSVRLDQMKETLHLLFNPNQNSLITLSPVHGNR